MSSTVETVEVRPHGLRPRRRVAIMAGLTPALAALAVLATGPAWATSQDLQPATGPFASASLSATPSVENDAEAKSDLQPVTAPSPSAEATPFVSGPSLKIQPPPKPKVVYSSRGKKVSIGNFTCPAEPQASAGSSAKSFLSAINAERKRAGLPALGWSSSLASSAQGWSEAMAAKDEANGGKPGDALAHGGKKNYRGQNVGVTSNSPGNLHAAFMRSSGHCANIMNPRWSNVGVGLDTVTVEWNGHPYNMSYVTVNFS